MYRLLNSMIRATDDPFSLFYTHILFHDLFKAVKHMWRSHKVVEQEFKVYRSTMLSDQEISFFRENSGQVIELLGFVSTSRNIGVTSNFRGNALIEVVVGKNAERDEKL